MIEFTNKGLYCARGNFYIDPWQPVERAIITHAHSDHARAGSRFYKCTHHNKPILKNREGENPYKNVVWGETNNNN
jgi:putative mRNA 3-end processing factor